MSSQDLSISGQSRSRHFLPVVRSDICQRRLPGDIGQCPLNNLDMNPKILKYAIYIQSGASSQAKHGGAYFSAVSGSIKDPIAVPGRHEVPGV